jgi:FAD/FMN-containing dehydrogenase
MVQENDIVNMLKSTIKGEVLVAGDSGYDAASTTFTTKGSPAVIVRPTSAGEVAKVIAAARGANMTLSVRSGGHSNAGHSTNDGGMVIDTTRMNSVKIIDEVQHIVRVGAGATWGEVAATLTKHGLAISSGDTETVGVGGLALAAGVGWMVRKYGLTIDHIVGVELVTADGAIIHANANEHADLFWALRGGGGNFGVATSFDIVAQRVGKVYAGMIMYDLHELKQVLTGWRDCMRAAPDELTTMLLTMPPNPYFPGMPSAIILLICYAGDDKTAAMKAIDPLLSLGTVLNKDIKRKDYADVLAEAHPPQGVTIISNDAFVHELSDELIDVICEAEGQILQIRSVGGAMNRVAPDATAFAHRDNEALIVAPTFVKPGATAAETEAALAAWRSIEAFASGAYVNFFSDDSEAHVAAGYPTATYDRLARIKAEYDPDNIFHRNFNIKPAGSTA